MHIAVFGATNNVGKATVVRLIEQNHTVTVFEDGENPFTDHPSIKVVQGDITSSTNVIRVLENADAVISIEDNWRGTTLTAPVMRNVLGQMEQQGIWRIIMLTNALVRIEGDHDSSIKQWVGRFYRSFSPKALRDSENQIRFLQSSKADWTVIRIPYVHSHRQQTVPRFSLNRPFPWQRIHQKDVAAALVDQLSDDHYINQAPFLRAK